MMTMVMIMINSMMTTVNDVNADDDNDHEDDDVVVVKKTCMVAYWHDDHVPLRTGPGCEDGWRTYPGSSYTYNNSNRRL
jgi:hypothetical protein